MLLPKPSHLICVVALTSSALASTHNKRTVDLLAELTSTVIKARQGLEGWTGGLISSIPVAHKVQAILTAATTAHTNVVKEEPVQGEQHGAILDVYENLQPEILGALDAAEKQAAAFKEIGVAFVARALLGDIRAERDRLEKAVKQRVQPSNSRMAISNATDVDRAFDRVMAAFAT